MSWKKKLIAGMAMIAAVAMIAGCGGDAKKEAAQTLPQKITVGLDDNFPPMGFRDDSGKIVGFDIDMATEVGKRLNIPVEFKAIDWSAKEAELKSKKVDLLWNGLTITEERKKAIDFSNPYMDNQQILVVKADSPIQAKADFNGKLLGTQEGSSSVTALDKDEPFKKSLKEVKLYGDFVAAFMDLELGRIDGMLVDSVVGRYYMQQKPGAFRALDDSMGSELFGVGLRKEDTLLRDKINQAFTDMKKDGTSAKISEKWFGKDVTK